MVVVRGSGSDSFRGSSGSSGSNSVIGSGGDSCSTVVIVVLMVVRVVVPDIKKKSTSESIKLLMNSNDYYVNKLVMKFISSCTNRKECNLS